ncbi:glycoside hydrolase family 3 N-terminal domain-containing protein [Cereibacter sp. SYSU M97828]|nr:glycoside hydrolase family 3 N-terminal domain-containing protein [Cereibacter flavus]
MKKTIFTTALLALGTAAAAAPSQPQIGTRSKQAIESDGLQFRDANGNGQLDPYEDWRLSVPERVADLVPRMSQAEKAGMLLIDQLNAGCNGAVDGTRAQDYIRGQHMTRFILRNTVTATPGGCVPEGTRRSGSDVTATQMASFTNAAQALAEATPLGIPLLFKSNARNHYNSDPRFGISGGAGAMTEFPKEPGIAAAVIGTGSTAPVETLADVMAAEWTALGIRGMYGYMADLATEPRWYRVHETFGEDSATTTKIVSALIHGLQGERLSPETAVALTLKHFPGGGPQLGGLDPHYSFGKDQVYPGKAFADHVAPFQAAIAAGVSAIMPYYGVPVDAEWEGKGFEQVGMSFSRQMIDGFLRGELGFSGYVNSDTGIIEERGWGLEDRTPAERFAIAFNAGADVMSGFHDIAPVEKLIDEGTISTDRLDQAVGRLLTEQFALGLFENPYVDESAADKIVGNDAHREAGLEVQRQSVVLLKNDGLLPLAPDARVYTIGMRPDTFRQAGLDVTDGSIAERPAAGGHDIAVIRVSVRTVNTRGYRSNDLDYGADPDRISPYTGQVWGAGDPCNLNPQVQQCVDDSALPDGSTTGLSFGGALPWEVDDLSFSAMAKARSWQIEPSLDTIRQVMSEIGPDRTALIVNFRQPYVLDAESGLQDAAALVATFEVGDPALVSVLSGEFAPVGGLPFALAATQQAIIDNAADLPGYPASDTLYPFGAGLTYE